MTEPVESFLWCHLFLGTEGDSEVWNRIVSQVIR